MTNEVITTETGEIKTKVQQEGTIRDILENEGVRRAITEVLPKNFDATRFARVAMACLRGNPKLLQCNPTSFLSSLLQSAVLGLEPDTALGHSYIIPYGKEATLVVGYEGYIDLAYRSGVVTSIHANVVRDGEQFEWGEGSDPFIRHTPSIKPQTYSQNRQTYMTGRDVTHVYAVAKLVGGGHVKVVMMKEEVDAIRSRSRASHDGPWVTDPIAMQKKTAIRQLRKFLPMSPQGSAFHVAAGLDEQAVAGLSQNYEVTSTILDSMKLADDPLETPASGNSSETLVEGLEQPQPTEYGTCLRHAGENGHPAAWQLNKYGFQHKVEGSQPVQWCTPSKMIKEFLDDVGVSEQDFNIYLKDKAGITRGQIEPDMLEDAVNWIKNIGVGLKTVTYDKQSGDLEAWEDN